MEPSNSGNVSLEVPNFCRQEKRSRKGQNAPLHLRKYGNTIWAKTTTDCVLGGSSTPVGVLVKVLGGHTGHKTSYFD